MENDSVVYWRKCKWQKEIVGKLKKLQATGRGKCPICQRKRIKLLYEHRTEQNERLHFCKNCRHKSEKSYVLQHEYVAFSRLPH